MDVLPIYTVCTALMDEAGTPAGTRAHCLKTAEIALKMVQALNACGERADAELVCMSALLHDVKRACPDHAAAGAAYVREKGFPEAAEIIARHMDLGGVAPAGVDECEIVYLADKVAREDGFRRLSDTLASMPAEKRLYAEPRIEAAMKIQGKVEAITGRPLEAILDITKV